MKMNQDEAQKIIRDTYGENASAIGHTEDDGIVTIFWLYDGEEEDDFKCLTLE